ncbi:Lar family restriction alleviation protein [Burkholderia gladioli]|uniref:Lar family restriction alleviation protein n=1 Tax=Burkholderia gladioli TaxID=28095 RepID=UPI00163F83AA|nr:Lar family restriction alleviation protein [Burkholderia gladioli]MDN7805759.1 Lar family restriction alleviation protein [Burkholderia gladioli]
MIEQLYPCEHCGGRPAVGRSQRLIDSDDNRRFDFSQFGRLGGPPRIGDVLPRPPEAPKTEALVCIYCTGCGMSTQWETVGDDETAAKDRCAKTWNRRLNRPAVSEDELRGLIENELGACDAQLVLDMLSRANGNWDEIGPIFKMLAQRIVDATVVTFDTWPIAPVLEDASRFRKLVQLAKWIEVDGEDYIQFPKIHSPREHRDFLFEDRIAIAVDGMPDRDRW